MSAPALPRGAVPGAAAAARPSPFRVVLHTQWRWSRLWLLVSTVAAFAIPVASVHGAGDPAAGFPDPRRLLESMQFYGVWYALFAGMNGMVFATASWSADHAGRHVYALSLPVPRWYYVLLRFAAGALLLAVPAAALWIGAHLATAAAALPVGLHAYPDAIALRFALASLVAYALFFGIGSGSTHSAGMALAALIVLILLDATLRASGVTERSMLARLVMAMVRWPGVLQIFVGRWMLIDV